MFGLRGELTITPKPLGCAGLFLKARDRSLRTILTERHHPTNHGWGLGIEALRVALRLRTFVLKAQGLISKGFEYVPMRIHGNSQKLKETNGDGQKLQISAVKTALR